MSERTRALLAFVGFFIVAGILMSDRFEALRYAVPETLSYYLFIGTVAVLTVVGIYSWWQHYNGRQADPTVRRFRKWLEDPRWWLWPF